MKPTRRNFTSTIALSLIGAGAMLFCLASHLTAAESAAKKVVCLGDSITHRGYPKVLGELLKMNAINAGVSGQNSKAGLARLKKDALDQKPDVVVLLFGTNDSRLDSSSAHVEIPKFSENLTSIIRQSREAGAKVVLCTMSPINEEKYFTRHKKADFESAGGLGAVLTKYREAIQAVGKKEGATVLNLNQSLEYDATWLSADGVHPTEAGNKHVAELVAEVVGPMLKAEAPKPATDKP